MKRFITCKSRIKLDGIIIEHMKQVPMQDGTDYMRLFKASLEQHIRIRNAGGKI